MAKKEAKKQKVGQPALTDAKGAALAVCVIKYAHEKAKAEQAGTQKLRGIASDIHGLTRDGHLTFRRELEVERKKVRAELSRLGHDKNSHRVHGTSAATWFVYVSNFMGLSKAIEAGMSPFMDDGKTILEWGQLLKLSSVTRASEGSNAPTTRRGRGRPKLEGDKLFSKVTTLAATLDKDGLENLRVWCALQLKAK